MPLFNNNKKIGRVFHGTKEINKIYQGDKLVFQKLKPHGYIEIEVDSTSGSYMVPFAQGYQPYSFNVFVNGVFYGTTSGTGGPAQGYNITGLNGPTAKIMLTPTDETVPVGWGRAFGHNNSNSGGSGLSTNRIKLLKVLNDPDYAHLQSETSTGNDFKVWQYNGCTSLTQIPDEDMPDTVTIIGSGFRFAQYCYCTSLTTPVIEYISSGVTSIGNGFRCFQYSGCTSLTQAADENMPDNIITIDTQFRQYQYYSCTSLIKAGREAGLFNTTYFGNNFRMGQYANCSNLRIGNYIHTYQFPTMLNALGNTSSYYQMFYSDTGDATPDEVPRYYTDSSNTTTAPITDLTPTNRKAYLTNRTGIPNYNGIHVFWKILAS